jgi:D-alanyl-D-alanine carboxypeptidase/D-alanyl-D-alanine-endopeptidase (penicillin-binding protein 4)
VRTFRRIIGPVLLAAIAVGAGVAAVVLDRAETTTAAGEDGPATVTPVLSPRRLPEYVTTPGADLTLRLRLIDLVATAPPDSCLAVEVDGRPVLAHQADRSVVPASNQKTATAAAALELLGPDHRFTTELRAGGIDGNGVVQGDAWLVGGGDPQLSTADYAATTEAQGVARTALEDLADAVVGAGITRITGRLVGDETRYDAARTVPTWRPGGTRAGPLSALSVNDGFASYPTAANPGAAFEVTPDPPRTATATLAFLLAERGVALGGGVDVGPAPDQAATLAQVESAPLAEIVGELLTYSDNQTSELLVKELGLVARGAGTTAAGAEAVAGALAEAGLDLSGTRVVDGSGLSGTNLLTCQLLLAALSDAPADSPLNEGMAIAGETGTLAQSFQDTPAQGRLRAKTGSLNDVTSLAGFVDNEEADDVVFALVLYRPPFIQFADAELRNQIALVLADYPERPPLDEVGPRPVDP